MGYIKPCPCKAPPAGGLARRIGFIEDYILEHPDLHVMMFEGGNSFKSVRENSAILWNETLLDAMEIIGYRYYVPG